MQAPTHRDIAFFNQNMAKLRADLDLLMAAAKRTERGPINTEEK